MIHGMIGIGELLETILVGAGTTGVGTIGAGTTGVGTTGAGTTGIGTIGAGTIGVGTTGAGTTGVGMAVPIIGTDLYLETDITAKETTLIMAIIATEAIPLQQQTTSLYTEDKTTQETIISIAKDLQLLKEITITKREDLL